MFGDDQLHTKTEIRYEKKQTFVTSIGGRGGEDGQIAEFMEIA